MPTPENYSAVIPLLSGSISLPDFSSTIAEKDITLQGNTSKTTPASGLTYLPYSVGTQHDPFPVIYQHYAAGQELWEIINLAQPPDWINGLFIRAIYAENNKLFLVLVPMDEASIITFRLVVLDLSAPPATVAHTADFISVYKGRPVPDKFGSVAAGHGFLIVSRENDLWIINISTYEWEAFRGAYLNLASRSTLYQAKQLLPFITPEGILLIPTGIFFDGEAYYYLPEMNFDPNIYHIPIYTNRHILIPRPFGAEANQVPLSQALAWVNPDTGFQTLSISTDDPQMTLIPAPWGNGDTSYYTNEWVSYGCDRNSVEERLVYLYKLSGTTLIVNKMTNLPTMPLPATSSLWQVLPTYADNMWSELLFHNVFNGIFFYTQRLWNRIYRFAPDGTNWDIATIIPIQTNDEYEDITPEVPFPIQLAYDRKTGQMIAVGFNPWMATITIARQVFSIIPLPSPTIQQIDLDAKIIIFQPAVHPSPQEFKIIFYTAYTPGLAIDSFRDRSGWEVSQDGGTTWQPMTAPVSRTDVTQNILIRYNVRQRLPFVLPFPSIHNIKIIAYGTNTAI